MTLEQALRALRDDARRRPFAEVPDSPGYWYAVWLDHGGARDLSSHTPTPVAPGIIYAGKCPTQSLRRHLAHSDIGSLTLMKNLAALFRRPWGLRAVEGNRLHEPGRQALLAWMADHLTATATPAPPDIDFKRALVDLDPPLRLIGWQPERTELRSLVKQERAELDAGR
jgi:hypothetical protein